MIIQPLKPSIILCTFFNIKDENIIYDYIHNFYPKVRIFVYLEGRGEDKAIATFTINRTDRVDMQNTISVHRRKETGTFFTINALNYLIRNLNNGKLIEGFELDWSLYENSLLITRNDDFRKIPITFEKIVQ